VKLERRSTRYNLHASRMHQPAGSVRAALFAKAKMTDIMFLIAAFAGGMICGVAGALLFIPKFNTPQ